MTDKPPKDEPGAQERFDRGISNALRMPPLRPGDWLRFIGLLVTATIVVLGGVWTLYTRTDDRITRLEQKVDTGFMKVSDALSDLRVEVAKRETPITPNQPK